MKDWATAAVPVCGKREKREVRPQGLALIRPFFFLLLLSNKNPSRSRRSHKTSQGCKWSEPGPWLGSRGRPLSLLGLTCPLCWVPVGVTTILLQTQPHPSPPHTPSPHQYEKNLTHRSHTMFCQVWFLWPFLKELKNSPVRFGRQWWGWWTMKSRKTRTKTH